MLREKLYYNKEYYIVSSHTKVSQKKSILSVQSVWLNLQYGYFGLMAVLMAKKGTNDTGSVLIIPSFKLLQEHY